MHPCRKGNPFESKTNTELPSTKCNEIFLKLTFSILEESAMTMWWKASRGESPEQLIKIIVTLPLKLTEGCQKSVASSPSKITPPWIPCWTTLLFFSRHEI